MGSPCLTPTAELMSFHPLIASLDGLPYACNVQQRRLGELLLDGRDKGVSVDGVEGVLEVERDMRTLLWPRSKVFRTPCTTFSALSRMPILNWAGAKRLQGSSPFDVGS